MSEKLSRWYFGEVCDFSNQESCNTWKKKTEGLVVQEKPMFSFMMAVYQDVSLFNSAVSSLLKQDYENWELLILDNDNDEKTWEMIQNAVATDSRIRAYKSDENVGWAKGAAELLKYVRGTYVTFLAADDCINRGALQRLEEVIVKEEQPDVIWVGADGVACADSQVQYMGKVCPDYAVYSEENRSEAILEIMRQVYYSSFFHYMRVDFLEQHNIDFFEPYYADYVGMTKCMTAARKMVVVDAMIYSLTLNTSQTRGHYVWGAYDFGFANQWRCVREVFEREQYSNYEGISYVAGKILRNLCGNISSLCMGRCRNKYMNSIEKTNEEIIRHLEDIFSCDDIGQMFFVCGPVLEILLASLSNLNQLNLKPDSECIQKSWLRPLLVLSMSGEQLNKYEKIALMTEWLLLEKNSWCIGFDEYADLLGQLDDEMLMKYRESMNAIVKKYDNKMTQCINTFKENHVESVESVLSKMEEFCKNDKIGELEEIDSVFNEYMRNTPKYKTENAVLLAGKGYALAQHTGQNYYYLMTFLLQATKSLEIYKTILKHMMQDDELTKENRFFLREQLVRYSFLNGEVTDAELGDLSDNLYYQIYDEYWAELNQGYSYIPKEERDEDFVIVMSAQVLNMMHGPTKTLCDRCYILAEHMKKNILIINTAEQMSSYQCIPCFNQVIGSYEDEYSDVDRITYQEKTFGFYQCPREMPQVSIIKNIMDMVQQLKPYFILTIGKSLVGDLCSNIVPVIGLSTVPSGRMTTKATFQIIGRKVNDDDRAWMQKHGLQEDHIVESLFTSSFNPQTHQYTREQLGLPEDQFIVLLVGGRLDDEIDEECVKVLVRLAEKGIFIAFMGKFEKYNSLIKKQEPLIKQSAFLGFQQDVLAVNECCDAYLNPKRVGGGTSCAEALYKGLPVATLDYGDVGVGAGPDFHVADYEEMYERIVRYAEDKEYYAQMSQKARQRAELLTDSKTEFIKAIRKIEESDRF